MRFSSVPGMVLLLATSFAHADTIIMDNGDRYSGAVTSMSSGTLQLQSDFGKLTLPWTRIAELKSDQLLELTLASGARLTGTIDMRQGVVRFAENDLANLTLPLAAIAAITSTDAPDLRIEARINLGLAATSGNTDTESYHTDGEFIARTAGNRFRLSGQFNYAAEDNRRTENNASAEAIYDHFLSQRWYFNTNLGLARDEFKDLDLRTTAGIGLGYQFRDQTDARLAAELGLSYVHEDFDAAEDQGQPAGRYALNFLRRLSPGPVLFHRHEVLAGLQHNKDVLLQTETGLRLPLLQNITGTLQVNFDYDWQPAPGTSRGDTAYLVTLGYEFLP